MDETKKEEMAEFMVDLINAAHELDDGVELVPEKERANWVKVIAKWLPAEYFLHPERHWDIEKYVKAALAKDSMKEWLVKQGIPG